MGRWADGQIGGRANADGRRLAPPRRRVNTSEASLISINDFIEHSPLFAKRLIDSVDVIREDALRGEVSRCAAELRPRLRGWFSAK